MNIASQGQEQLNARVRAGFILAGETLHSWSRSQGYHPQNVRKVLIGEWCGPRAEELRAEVLDYLRSKGVEI